MIHPNGKNLSEIAVGDSASFSFALTEDIHQNFKEYVQDTSPIHNDDEFAQQAGFGKKIAYGFNVASYFSRFYGNYLPGGSSICLKQEIIFSKPVYIGDVLTVSGEVTAVNKNLKIVHIKNQVVNQRGDICVTGEGIVKIII